MILKGKPVADRIYRDISVKLEETGIVPHLAVVLVGDDSASKTYVGMKHRRCERLGFRSTEVELAADTPQREIEDCVRVLSENPEIHGILVQSPLPDGRHYDAVIDLIDPRKDVDGFHPHNVGRLTAGSPGMVPCTPQGILEMLDHYHITTTGKRTVVVGRSRIVGEPITRLLSAKHIGNATVTQCHTGTLDLRAELARAELVIAAAGVPHLIKAGDVAAGATVIDVGIHRIEDGLIGDFDPTGAAERSVAYSPVPKGVGPLTVACLMMNTLKSALLLGGSHA